MSTLLNKTAWSAVGGVANSVVRFVFGIIIARQLGAIGFGQVAYFIWLIEISNVISGLGIQSTFTRFLADLNAQDSQDRTVSFTRWIYSRYLLSLAFGIMVLGAFIAFSGQYPSIKQYFYLLAILFFMQGMGNIYYAALSGMQKFKTVSQLNLVSSVLTLAFLYSASRYYGLSGVLLAYIAGYILPAALSLSLIKKHSDTVGLSSALMVRVLKYAAGAWFAGVVSALVWSRSEVFFLEKYCGAAEVSRFALGLSLSAVVTQGIGLLMGPLMPHFAELVGAKDIHSAARIYRCATRMIALLVFPAGLFGAAIIPELLPMIYGPQFVSAIPIAVVLVVLSIFSFTGVGSSLVFGMEKSGFVAFSGILGSLVSILLCYILVPVAGAWGAVWVRAFVQISLVILGLFYIHQYLKVAVPHALLVRTLIAATFSAVPVFIVGHVFQGFPGIVLGLLLGLIIYAFAIKVIRAVDSEDSDKFVSIITVLPKFLSKPLTSFFVWVGT